MRFLFIQRFYKRYFLLLSRFFTFLTFLFLFERFYIYARSRAIAEIARVGSHYAVQGHSRSLILVPIESPYATSC